MYCGHNLECLTEFFCENLSTQKSDPFDDEFVICQSKTMEQYLNKNIADKKGIAANIQYRFPRNSINDILKLCPTSELVTRLDPAYMVWEIYNLLPELEKDEKYQILKDYIHSDNISHAFRRYQLALQISSIFDGYMGYRGDWLEAWQRGEMVTTKNDKSSLNLGVHEQWQADLWCKLTIQKSEKITFMRSSQLLKDNIDKIDLELLNNRSIFGISHFPQDYIDFFAILKEKVNLNFYYLMPCVEYWGDISKVKAVLEEEGNRLLASWGMVGRDFFELLINDDFDISPPEEELREPDPTEATLLEALQFDIITNTPVTESVIKNIPPERVENDNSIVINNAYSRMREVEVLHDYILDLLNSESCELSDIVVMAPNIEDYAPYIQAVFKHGESANIANSSTDSEPYISYRLTDCSTLFTSPEAETFMKFLYLPESKMNSEELFEIISSKPVIRKFNFSKDDIEIMYKLILDANIAWGKDCEHRSEILGENYNDKNSWRFGFKRILAGYAFDCEEIVEDGTLPLYLDSSNAIVAGKLIDICEMIFQFSDKMNKEYTPDDWHNKIFSELISLFFELSGAKNDDIIPLKQAIESLKNSCNKAGFEEKLPLDVVRVAIEKEFKEQSTGRSSFFRGGLTFCQLLPMRNIPFKTICIIGMNDGEFPRIDTKNGFNLALKEFRRGDRSLRNEDRYIFLETLLACQENFYISYIGQSNSDNKELSPSVIVDELLDYFELIGESVGNKALSKDNFLTKHPLHGFDEKYFLDDNDKRFYSYSKVYLKAADSFANSAKKPIDELFCSTNLDLSDKTPNDFSFEEFVSFFLSPSKFFLKYILNINLNNETIEPLKIAEPFELNPLDSYNILNDSMSHKLKGKKFDIGENIKASGTIPSGVWGDDIITASDEITDKLHDEVSSLGAKKKITKPIKLKFNIDGFEFTLSGTFDNIYENGQAYFRPGTVKVKDKLKAWIWHQLALKSGLSIPKTTIIGWDKSKSEIKVNNIYSDKEENKLSNNITMLMNIFIRGLRKPLPLFIHSSPEYVKVVTGTKRVPPLSPEDGLKKVSEKWDKPYSGFDYDLSEDANFICFGDTPPSLNDLLKDEFIELAEAIFKPLNSEVK